MRGGQVAGRAGALVREGIVTGQQLARVALHGVLRAVPRTTCLGRLLDGGAGEVVFPSCRHAFYGFRTGGGKGRGPGRRRRGAGIRHTAGDDVGVRDAASREELLACPAPGAAGRRVTDGKLHFRVGFRQWVPARRGPWHILRPSVSSISLKNNGSILSYLIRGLKTGLITWVNPRSQTELAGINSGQDTRSSLMSPRKPGKKIQLIPHDVYQVISRQTKPTSSPPSVRFVFTGRQGGTRGGWDYTPLTAVANGFRGACRFVVKPPVTGSGAPGRIVGSPLFMWPGGRYKSGVFPRRSRGVGALASRHSFNLSPSRFVLLYT